LASNEELHDGWSMPGSTTRSQCRYPWPRRAFPICCSLLLPVVPLLLPRERGRRTSTERDVRSRRNGQDIGLAAGECTKAARARRKGKEAASYRLPVCGAELVRLMRVAGSCRPKISPSRFSGVSWPSVGESCTKQSAKARQLTFPASPCHHDAKQAAKRIRDVGAVAGVGRIWLSSWGLPFPTRSAKPNARFARAAGHLHSYEPTVA